MTESVIVPELRACMERLAQFMQGRLDFVEIWGAGASQLHVSRALEAWPVSRVFHDDALTVEEAASILTLRQYIPKSRLGWFWIGFSDGLMMGPIRRAVRDRWRVWRLSR